TRLSLLWRGRMPTPASLPEHWYDTPNIHHVTIKDFRSFVAARGIRIEAAWFLTGGRQTPTAAANLLAEHAVFLLSTDRNL
ncbi:MAG: methionine biosynthesis protein MetW, partial [Sphingomonas sp.]